jgi:hypothetical protein
VFEHAIQCPGATAVALSTGAALEHRLPYHDLDGRVVSNVLAVVGEATSSASGRVSGPNTATTLLGARLVFFTVLQASIFPEELIIVRKSWEESQQAVAIGSSG